MGQNKSKAQVKTQEKPVKARGKGLPEIPRDSLLGWMLEHWEDCFKRRGKSKEKIIHYCIEIWGHKEIRRHWVWPVFGTFERWTCQNLYNHVAGKYPQDREEMDYARLWGNASTGLFLIRTCKGAVDQSKAWEP